MRLLLYNPNSDQGLTETLTEAVAVSLAYGDKLESATAKQGPRFIGSDATIAEAREPLTDALQSWSERVDAILLGCFGDLRITDLRLTLKVPVLSLSDAFFATAPFLGKRLAIVTTSAFWADWLEKETARRGLEEAVAAIVPALGAAGAAPDQLSTLCRVAIGQVAQSTDAQEIVLAGALLAPLRRELAGSSPVPIVDILRIAVSLCRALI